MKLVSKKLALALSLAVLTSSSAMAAATSGSIQVTATVSASCQLTTNNLTFGAFVPSAVATTMPSTTTISTTCTKTTPYTIGLSAGTGTFAARTMAGAKTGNTDKLSYSLHTDAAGASIFGDGTTGTSTVAGAGTGAAVTTTIYGKIPVNQFLTPDSYADTITVTVNY